MRVLLLHAFLVSFVCFAMMGCKGLPCPNNDDQECFTDYTELVCNEAVPCPIGVCGTCQSPGMQDDPCAENQDCLEGLVCDEGVCKCRDLDEDGYGYPASEFCLYPEWDCDDTNPDVNPGATEGPEGDPTCSDTLDNDCDGRTDMRDIECNPFEVWGITPIYLGQWGLRWVDVEQGNCADPPDPPDPEPFDHHYAKVTLRNWCSTQTCSTIDVISYQIWYQPETQGAPELPPSDVIPIVEPVSIEPCEPDSVCPGETISQIEFVPMEKKQVLNDFLMANPSILQLRYYIFYTFFGEKDLGGNVSADGVSIFYAANYNFCGF